MKYLLVPIMLLGSTAIGEVKVFILSGQSNMLGSAKIKDLQPANYLVGVNNVSYYVSGFPGNPPEFKFSDPIQAGNTCQAQPKCTARPCIDGENFGLEIGIAKILSQSFPRDRIVLLKSAAGGTSLGKDWLAPNSPTFSWLIDRTKSELVDVKSRYGNYTLSGLIWYQGESDGNILQYAQDYKNNLTQLIQQTRNALQAQNLPFFYGVIKNAAKSSGGYHWPFGNIVQKNQRTLRNVTNLGCTNETSKTKVEVYPLESTTANGDVMPGACDPFWLGYNQNHLNAKGSIFAGESLGRLAANYILNSKNSIKCVEMSSEDVVFEND
jgi:hypothetical protein